MNARSWRSRAARAAFHVFGALVTLLLLVPLVLSLLVSVYPGRSIGLPTPATGFTPDWYRAVLDDPLFRLGLTGSIVVGSLTALFSLLLALPLAAADARHPSVRRLALVVVLPVMVPPVVLGMQSLVAFEFAGVRGSRVGLALAHTLWGLPLAFLTLRAAFRRIDPHLAEAARSLGAPPWRAALEVTLPLLRPAMAAGALLAFLASVNELIMSLFLGVRTLPTVIWPQVRHAVQPDIAAASTILLLLGVVPAGLAVLAWARLSARSSRRPPPVLGALDGVQDR